MKQRRKNVANREPTFRVWTQAQAESVLPYLTSVMQSLREQYLTALAKRLQIKRLQKQPGRPDRNSLLAQQEAERTGEQAEDQFNAALKELWHLNIYCLDPIQGLALIPFAHGEQLAWFIFDLFDKQKLTAWRYHADPLETRRPLAEALQEPPSPELLV